MKPRARLFQPNIQTLEDRTVLSFSFSHLLHSAFPFIPDKTAKPKHKPAVVGTASTIAPAALTPHVRAVHRGHVHAMVMPIAPGQNVAATPAHPRGAFNVYGALPAALHSRVR